MRFLLAPMLSLPITGGRTYPQENSPTLQVLVLEQAISLVQSLNRQLKISRQSVLSANDQILAAHAQRYPQFNIQFTAGGLLTPLSVSFPEGAFGISHVIVLFDFIEEMHEKGELLEQALLDAGIFRLRRVMITVGATILAGFPLAVNGGPLWQPLRYEQIGGLGVAIFITLLLVPVLYSIFVLGLKIVKWAGPAVTEHATGAPTSKGESH